MEVVLDVLTGRGGWKKRDVCEFFWAGQRCPWRPVTCRALRTCRSLRPVHACEAVEAGDLSIPANLSKLATCPFLRTCRSL
eukprot:365719-Chlamydomonas_euryale.AAC.4